MKKLLLLSICCLPLWLRAQTLQQKIQQAYQKLQASGLCQYASVSLTVLDAQTGQTVFTANPNMGLATASTLKTVTAITAFNLLGKDFTYQTTLTYNGTIDSYGTLNGNLIIKGSGDPTLGSWRYASTTPAAILSQWVDAIKKAGIKRVNGFILGDDSVFGSQTYPDGWIWQDMGNYYGAAPSGLCWHENLYTVKLKTGAAGTPISVGKSVPEMSYLDFKSELLNSEPGTGDKAYAYLPVNSKTVYLRGTYATDQTRREVELALPDPAYDVAYRLVDTLKKAGIDVQNGAESIKTATEKKLSIPAPGVMLLLHNSPKLSQIIYWQDQRSINLYAEQLLRTLGFKMGKGGNTDAGVEVVQGYWKAKGIDPNSLNIADGSGLSPGTRVTTLTLARILQSARKESWFTDFYDSLPTFNNLKMKSGSINNVLCYAGYHTPKGGHELVFSIMVNNYSGSTWNIKQKIFETLDALK